MTKTPPDNGHCSTKLTQTEVTLTIFGNTNTNKNMSWMDEICFAFRILMADQIDFRKYFILTDVTQVHYRVAISSE